MSDDFRQSGGSPWGTPPGGGSGNGSGRGPTPPDIEKIIREFQEKIKKFLPGGSSSGGKQAVLVLIILVLFCYSFLSVRARCHHRLAFLQHPSGKFFECAFLVIIRIHIDAPTN